VRFTSHAHDGFRLAQCRNEGVLNSTAPYLVFLDGDCIIPPDYLRHHLARRRPRVAITGDCCRLDRETSERIDEEVIRSGEFMKWAPRSERKRLDRERLKAWYYSLTRNRNRPKLFAGTAAMWREDYERVNGYDENFQGWGCEDDDLRSRLTRSGVRVQSILWRTFSYHLWHPPVPSFPKTWREGPNVHYLTRGIRLKRCRNGLRKLSAEDRVVRLAGAPERPELLARVLPARWLANAGAEPEVEILALPGSGAFSGRAECNLLVLLEDVPVPSQLTQQAHVVLARRQHASQATPKWHSLDDFDNVLRAVA